MKILDFIHNTKTQAILAFVILIGGSFLIIYGKLNQIAETKVLDMMYITIGFYFIASKSGDKKDETIANLSGQQQQPVITTDADIANLTTNKEQP